MPLDSESWTYLLHPQIFSWLAPVLIHIFLGEAWKGRALQTLGGGSSPAASQQSSVCCGTQDLVWGMAMQGCWHSLSWLQASQRMPALWWHHAGCPQKSSQRSVLHCACIDSKPGFLLFSAEFVFAHKALNQHNVEPGKSRELEHLIRKRHF